MKKFISGLALGVVSLMLMAQSNVGEDWTNSAKDFLTSGDVTGAIVEATTGFFYNNGETNGVDRYIENKMAEIKSDADYTSLPLAITDIGATKTVLRICNDNVLPNGTNITQPSTLTFDFSCGGSIDGDSGGWSAETLTINGPIIASPDAEIFGASLTTTRGSYSGTVYPNWWLENTTPGTTDMSGAIQAAIDFLYHSDGDRTGGEVKLHDETYSLSTTGITLYEDIHLIGSGNSPFDGASMVGGTWLTYSGSGNAITIDGAWTGFDARRNIHIRNMHISAGSGIGIWADFMTQFQIRDVTITSSGTYGMYMRNCYQGSVHNLWVRGGSTYGVYATIDTADPVFSGQTMFTDCRFNEASDSGLYIISSVNTYAQTLIEKCQFQSNAYGLYMSGANVHAVTVLASHFESNSSEDIHYDSSTTGARNPNILSSFFNNGVTSTKSVYFGGTGGSIKNCEFTLLDNSAYAIELAGDMTLVEGNTFRASAGDTMQGVHVTGDFNKIRDLYYNVGGVARSMNVITIDAGATGTHISNLVEGDNITGVSPVRVTNNGESTIYEDAQIVYTPVWDNDSAALQETGWQLNQEGFINRAWVVYPDGTGTGNQAIINVGVSTAPGFENWTSIINTTAKTSAQIWETEDLSSDISGRYINESQVLIARTDGQATNPGTMKLKLEFNHYRAEE